MVVGERDVAGWATPGGVEELAGPAQLRPASRTATRPTATPLFLDGKDQQTIDHLASLSPLQRLGRPDDVAFVAGPARWINGQVIYTNGGIV